MRVLKICILQQKKLADCSALRHGYSAKACLLPVKRSVSKLCSWLSAAARCSRFQGSGAVADVISTSSVE